MGYKMKGPTFFGKKKSPAKVSDSALVDAQAKLDNVELDYREPGWATVARGVHQGAKDVMRKFQARKEAGDYDPNEEKDNAQAMNVQDIVSKTGDLDNMEGL